jgi:hypothetical protein
LPFDSLPQTLILLIEWCTSDLTSDAQTIAGTQLISSIVNKHVTGKILPLESLKFADYESELKPLIEEYLPNLWQQTAYNPKQVKQLRARVLKVWVVVSIIQVMPERFDSIVTPTGGSRIGCAKPRKG